MRTFGLIPAAGKSQRMGQPKLLLPLGDSTVLERVLSAMRSAQVADVLVVVAPDADALATVAEASGARVLRLSVDTPDMLATIQHGLVCLEEQLHPADTDGWLLLPADHPTVRPDVVQALLAAAQADTEKSIIVPTYQGRRGHPTWLRWSHAAAVLGWASAQGLNAYIRAHSAQTLELAWPSDEILHDLDTPDDYERIIQSLKR